MGTFIGADDSRWVARFDIPTIDRCERLSGANILSLIVSGNIAEMPFHVLHNIAWGVFEQQAREREIKRPQFFEEIAPLKTSFALIEALASALTEALAIDDDQDKKGGAENGPFVTGSGADGPAQT